MAKIKFRIRNKDANKNVSIKIRVSSGRGTDLEVNTLFTIHPNEWSEKYNFPKQTTGENKRLSTDLKKLETFILDKLNQDLASSTLIDTHWLRHKVDECFNRVVKTDTGLLTNHIQNIIDNANTRQVRSGNGFKIGLSASTVKNYNLFKNIISEYQEKEIKRQIQFLEVTKSFADKFKNWLINEKNYSANYAGKQLEMLKTVCIDADRNEIPVTPFSKTIQHFRESDKDRYIQTLSFAELDQIKNADFTDAQELKEFKTANADLCRNILITPETLNNARNWILLGCEIGQRGGDLLNLTNDNIRFKGKSIYIDLVQQKTNKSVTVGIIAPHVLEIVQNGMPKQVPHQKFNDLIKIVCKLSGIVEIVKGTKLNTANRKEFGLYPKYEIMASHSLRRSFSSNYYKIIPTAILINITGHSKESLFLTYINKREDKDANADLFMKFYEDLHQHKEPVLKLVKSN